MFKQAFILSKTINGDYTQWTWNQIPSGVERVEYFWKTYLFPYLSIMRSCFPITSECFSPEAKFMKGNALAFSDSRGGFVLNDGTTVLSWAGGDTYAPHVFIYFDINGLKKPNIVGKDIFVMFFRPKGNTVELARMNSENNEVESEDTYKEPEIGLYFESSHFKPEDFESTNVRVRYEGQSSYGNVIGCTKDSPGNGCGAYIQMSGWKIPDKYPW